MNGIFKIKKKIQTPRSIYNNEPIINGIEGKFGKTSETEMSGYVKLLIMIYCKSGRKFSYQKF